MERTLTEELDTIGGHISMIRLFIDCTRDDLRPKTIDENTVMSPGYYVCRFTNYQYPVMCYSKEPFDGVEDFVRNYMQNEKWKEPHKKFTPAYAHICDYPLL